MPTVSALPRRLCLGPGPSPVPPRVLAALATPTIGHLDPAFLALMDDLRAKLRTVFATANPMTLAMSGTGSAGMETVIVNLVEPGDRVVVGVNGVFGGRLAEVARRAGAEVITVDGPWGQTLDRDALAAAIAAHAPRLVAVVHAETSTGVVNPIDGLADRVHAHDGLLVVDCVTSLAGMPVELDAWGVDAAYSGTQKCLACPPGLSPVTLSPRAVARLDARRTKVPSWYLDLSLLKAYWGQERAYHHTAPINMIYALHEALAIVLEEGLPARFARHRAAHAYLAERLDALGLRFASQAGYRLPMLNAIAAPDGLDEAAVRRRLLDEHGVEIGGGLGALKGRAWRIGLMGEGATTAAVDAVTAGLAAVLGRAPT
ncbi:MAG: aminotransferase class V-fold PLP-dependent enzyme [Kofleriaceae bacterium]|nr:aminotransferase class V-fold PLP-dependent enzyme [Kofleriaceae bacterium]MBP9169489.1 aminotransferase class V-fold PLP-dependent enzyme [Kofleriaceae bacterium]MBP9862103.1 aminotransferase class V-fold PLP-dependent enzyme [Kofleriaceae bacterium]